MKVVHIITGLNEGGAEGVLTRMCLAEPDKHIVISLMDFGKYGPILKQAGIEVHCIKLNSSFFKIKKILQLFFLLKKIQPQIVQTWMYHADFLGGICARLAGIPNIFWGIRHSNLSKGNIKRTTYFIMKACAFLSYIIPKKIISCSREAINSHINQGYKKNKFVLIQNGYDLKKFKPIKSQGNRFDSDKPILGMVARYDIQKDHNNLIQALALLKKNNVSFHVVLVGSGMVEDNFELVKLISYSSLEVNKDITLYGRCDDIPLLMNSFDLHVLSSLGEAFPNVLAEAMACGIPCVATNVGDTKEIINNLGWIVPAQNPTKLAEAIFFALQEYEMYPDQWANRKSECIRHIKNNFEISSMIEKFHITWSGK